MSIATTLNSTTQGAGTGAILGSAIPGLGTALGTGIGAATGLLSGLFSSYQESQDQARKDAIVQQMSEYLNQSTEDTQAMLDDFYASNSSIGTSDDVDTYRSLIENYDPEEFVYDFDEFNDNYDVNDYYAANRDAIIQATSDKLQATAAGAGIGRGTGAARQIATGVADKNEELYQDALEAMNSDREFDYQVYSDSITNNQNRLNQLSDAYNTQLSNYGTLASDYQSWIQNQLQQNLDLQNNATTNQLSVLASSI